MAGGIADDGPVHDVYDAGGGFDPYDYNDGSHRAARHLWAASLGVLGELLITLGVIVTLYLGYELWWTNVTASQETQRNSAALLHSWTAEQPPAFSAGPSDAVAKGESFAFLYIPALGADWRALIMQSTDRTSVLNTGAVGHYTQPASALPWDPTGNFAVAGHRDGHGMIFRDLDRLAPGDAVYVQTRYGWFVYRLDREAAWASVTDVGAVEPIPVGSGFTGPGRYLTLTTCTPMYIDSHRLVWWGHLVKQTPSGQVPEGVRPTA